MTGPVVFEGSILDQAAVTGVGRVFLTALRAYSEIAPVEPVLLLSPATIPPDLPRVTIVRVPLGTVAKQIRLPRTLARIRPRVLHSPVAALPIGARCPMVATVHDLPWMATGLAAEKHRRFARLAIRAAVRRAQAILVASEATMKDLLAYAGPGLAPRIRLVHHGVERPCEPSAEADLRGPFLVLGDDRLRKNHDRLRRAHAHARILDPDLPALRFVGPPYGYVTEEEKGRLLRGSRALLYPSLFEGFGLPILEAMAHGLPVVTSNCSSLPEVAGDAALLVDPEDEHSMARAMVRVHRDQELRDGLRARGLERAALFTPLRTARAWLRIHDEVSREEKHVDAQESAGESIRGKHGEKIQENTP